MVGTPYAPDTLPDPFDVVWCNFPFHNTPGVPGVTPHPGLVFNVNEYKPGLFSVQIAYGTGTVKHGKRPHDFVVSNWNELHLAGLCKETRFDLDRVKWLMWDSDWFISPDPKRYPTPVIGKLSHLGQSVLGGVMRRRIELGLPVP